MEKNTLNWEIILFVLLDHSSTVANLIQQEQDFSIFGGLACGVDRNRCKECLELVGLSEAKNKKVKDYSLGMKQRLGLATALLANPDILILDEPINGLDPEGIRWVRNFLQSFVNEGKTVLMTSHYMSELELTVDHLVGISNGKIVIDAPTKDILKQFGSFEEAYFKALEGKEGE